MKKHVLNNVTNFRADTSGHHLFLSSKRTATKILETCCFKY